MLSDNEMDDILRPYEPQPFDTKPRIIWKCHNLNKRTCNFQKFNESYLKTLDKDTVKKMLYGLYNLVYTEKRELKKDILNYDDIEDELRDTKLLYRIAMRAYENNAVYIFIESIEEKLLYNQINNYYTSHPYPSLKSFFKKTGRLPSIKSDNWDEAICAYLHKTYDDGVVDRKLIKYSKRPYTFNY
jgi:hypothetical protein